MYQLELVFQLLVRLQFMYFQYNVYLKGNRHGLLEKFFYCLYAKLCLSYCHILNISEKYQLLPKIQLLFAITSC